MCPGRDRRFSSAAAKLCWNASWNDCGYDCLAGCGDYIGSRMACGTSFCGSSPSTLKHLCFGALARGCRAARLGAGDAIDVGLDVLGDLRKFHHALQVQVVAVVVVAADRLANPLLQALPVELELVHLGPDADRYVALPEDGVAGDEGPAGGDQV